MNIIYSTDIDTQFGEKTISVAVDDIIGVKEEIDVLTISSFQRCYEATPQTLLESLASVGIDVVSLAWNPAIDMRNTCSVWLSEEVKSPTLNVKRIGCVEMRGRLRGQGIALNNEQAMLNSIKAYFRMLDSASMCGVKMDTVALPLLGAGSQGVSGSLTVIPIINECVDFLKRNEVVKKIYFIDRNSDNAKLIAEMMKKSYSIYSMNLKVDDETEEEKPISVFISYASKDRNVADNLCYKLESNNIKVWYAPRNVHNDYATAIVDAIENVTHFVVILSENSMASEHVLNEIDLAFSRLSEGVKFKPLRIDTTEFAPAFRYYLSRQHWMDAHVPPLEDRLNEFVKEFIENL